MPRPALAPFRSVRTTATTYGEPHETREATMQGRLAICLRIGVLVLHCLPAPPTRPAPPVAGPEPPIPTPARWSDTSAWPDGVRCRSRAPRSRSRRTTVLLDVSPPALAGLTIAGALVFDERRPELTTGWIAVQGTLRIGTAAPPFKHHATITLTGSPDAPSVMGMGTRARRVGRHARSPRRAARRLDPARRPPPRATTRPGEPPAGAPATSWSWRRPTSIPTGPRW